MIKAARYQGRGSRLFRTRHLWAPEFNDFSFDGKKGDKKIVKTQFGYHYIDDPGSVKRIFEPAYKIAYMSKKIETSSETDQAASGQAINFAGQSRDQAAFDQNVQKDKLQKLVAQDIQPSACDHSGIGGQPRNFVTMALRGLTRARCPSPYLLVTNMWWPS